MENLEELISQISKIVLTEKTQQEERSKRGENFNIFKVLGLSTSEVRLHSAFLAELLKPDGSHGMGDSFLRAFLEIVIPDFKNTFDIASLEVIVEYVIDNVSKQDEEHGGRIDILIRNNCHQAIIIENKIYAEDQPSQLRRYFNFAKDEKYEGNDFLLLYLTLDGHDASPDSLRNKDNDKVPYTTISYKEHIINWLKRCTEIAALNPLVRETIRQYIINLSQLLNSMEESYKNAVIETLMKGENLSAALNIIDVSNDLKARIRKDFIDKRIKDLADNYQLQMTYDESALFLTKDKSIYFKKDDTPHFYYFISFETRRAWQGIQFNFINGQGPILSLDGLETIWDDGKGKEWPYGWAWLKNCDYWDTSDTLIDMRNGNQLINEIEENLKIVVSKQLLKKAEEAYMQRMEEMPLKAV